MIEGERARSAAPRVPELEGYGEGVFRRRILLEARDGRVVGELQDDFHHFAVDVTHDGSQVTAARGGGLRVPWTTCPGAIPPLERLRGLHLTTALRAAARHTDPRLQCTHLLDLASCAIAHAARCVEGAPGRVRRYDVEIPDRVRGRTLATLERDGRPVLAWEIDRNEIVAPDPFAGHSVAGRGFAEWADQALEVDLSEAAQVLRRACLISIGRRYDFARVRSARDFGEAVGGACHTFSPAHVGEAGKIPGSRLAPGSEPRAIFTPGFSPAFRERFDV
jgi:hypothetical protein